MREFIKGCLFGCSFILAANGLGKKFQLQPNNTYSGKEFTRLNTTSYYRIAPKDLRKLSDKEFLSQGNFEFIEKDNFVKNCLQNFNKKEEHVEKLIVTDETPEVSVKSYRVISVDGKNMKYEFVDPDVEFK